MNKTLVVCVDFEIDPSQLAAFMLAITENAALSLAHEAGCQRFDICQDPERPNKIFLYEIYDDEAAFAVHKNTNHYHVFNAAVDGMVINKSVGLFDKVN